MGSANCTQIGLNLSAMQCCEALQFNQFDAKQHLLHALLLSANDLCCQPRCTDAILLQECSPGWQAEPAGLSEELQRNCFIKLADRD